MTNDWRQQLCDAVTCASTLPSGFGSAAAAAAAVAERYPFCVTPYYLALADPADSLDPIARQCLPDEDELLPDDGLPDPFREAVHEPVHGLIQRYPDRALVRATSRCAVRCRHCTRKNTLADGEELTDADYRAIVRYLAATPSVREVIVSGGDPLLLGDDRIDWVLGTLRSVPHVRVLRIGSRVPVVLPMRITASLVDTLAAHSPLWFNTQFNHPRELTPQARAACARLIDAGIPVSNQAVLLRGMNDDVATLQELCLELEEARVRPYYVFVCDPVQGTAPFRTSIASAQELERELRTLLPGLAMPRFVIDQPGSPCKMPVREAGSTTT